MLNVQKPFLDKDELKNVGDVLDSCWLGMGKQVKEFEDEVKKYLGVKYFIAVNTGTSAIHLALEALDLKDGDEVIVPSLTFAGSIQPILYLRAKPVFCDVDYNTLNIDIKDVENKITKRTKAVLPVHYSGQPVDMDRLLKSGKKHGFKIVEDAAHAFGSFYKGKKIGSLGDMTCFSFDQIKNVTCGEGGCIATNNSKWAKKIILMRLLGIDKETLVRYKNKRSWLYNIKSIGFRYHMSNINAAIGLAQMKKMEKTISRKKHMVNEYDKAFANMKEIDIVNKNYDEIAPFNYIIKVKKNRNRLIDFLKEKGIDTGIHYIPNHIQSFFRKFRVKLPVTEKLYKEILTLPLYYGMSDKDVLHVINSVKEFFKK